MSTPFVTYLGWLHSWGAPLTLIGDNAEQILEARRELVRIGVDNVTGSAAGDIRELADGAALCSYRVADFGDLAKALVSGDLTVLDVRQRNEFDDSHIAEAVNIPLHELIGRIDEVPHGEVWVHCGSGYRAAIAASLIEAPGRTVVLIDDEFDNAAAEQELTR